MRCLVQFRHRAFRFIELRLIYVEKHIERFDMKRSTSADAGRIGGQKTAFINKQAKLLRIEDYNKNPKRCEHCSEPILYERRRNKFCDHSCAASYCNLGIKRNLRSGDWTNKECLECGIVTTNPMYCSRECWVINKHKKTDQRIESGQFDSVYPSKTLRDYLRRTRGDRCEMCGRSEWLEQPIPMNVHHIDGDASNNKPDNLQQLCLNCHGLTPNYGGKNKNKSVRSYRYDAKV